MDIKIQFHNITQEDYMLLFSDNCFPPLGYEEQLPDNMALINLSSDAPQLVDSGTFHCIIQFAGQVALDVAIGLFTSYLYDKLKKDEIKMTVNNRITIVTDSNPNNETAKPDETQ